MEHEVEDRYGIGAHFDAIGDAEWSRLDGDLAGRVAFEIHRRFLGRYLTAGDRVLEIGAGPGRFTIVLGELGCSVVATDLSEVQIELNAQRVTAAGSERCVEEWCRLDVRDLSRFEDGAFDAVVAFGGPGIHPCRLFAWSDVCSLVGAAGGELVGGSASNGLSLEDESKIEQFEHDPTVWGRFLDWEERWCSEPGSLDGGTHILFAARHPSM